MNESHEKSFLGEHLLIELHGCDVAIIDNTEVLQQLMEEAVQLAGATLVKSVFHSFSPVGVTGVVVIEESHFAIHTWPEHNYAAVDLFTCSASMDYKKAADFLAKKLDAKTQSVKLVKRGDLSLVKSVESTL